MANASIHHANLCDFDYSLRPDRADDAHTFLEYADRKIPAVFDAVSVPLPNERITLRYGDQEGGVFFLEGLEWIIELPREHCLKDCGCIIHEAVHATQCPGMDLPALSLHISEGIADYYRIVLSDDRQGDYFNDDKGTLVRLFNHNDPYAYDSSSEFIAHLRRRSGDPAFVIALNTALRSGDEQTLCSFLHDRFGHKYFDLLRDYAANRDSFVGANPADVSRYIYFTEM